jgi:hypothetical protein
MGILQYMLVYEDNPVLVDGTDVVSNYLPLIFFHDLKLGQVMAEYGGW